MEPLILYEDNHVIVAVKPQNIPSQADLTEDEDMLTILKEYIKEKHKKPGNVYLGLVHRLDRPTGGVMVFAKTSKAAARLSAQIAKHQVKKVYTAVLCGSLPSSGTLKDYLYKDVRRNISVISDENTRGAKYAELDYIKKDEKNGYSLAEITLKTGRSHQIRVQFSSRGFPVAGDRKYGGQPAQKLCLFASSLTFFHPVTKEEMTFSAPLPTYAPWEYFK